MPASPDSFNDYAELEIAHDGHTVDEENINAALNGALPSNLKSKTFKDKISSTKSSKSAIVPFLGAVNIDLERKKPVGLMDLFIAWLELGNKYWLNPMDKSSGLGVLEEILFKFQGSSEVLSPFIELLVKTAKNRISPRSFVEYVILPRMYQDYNWRKWKENHLEALQIIADLITVVKDRPPFNREHLGSGKTRLARDVVLVRYIGRPLAQFRITDLRDKTMLDKYVDAWQRISLQNPLSLYFMRNNALHFIYLMSGKIDLIQLIAIIEQLPYIERAFTVAFPNGITKLGNVQSMNLYDYDIENALYIRKQRGYHSIDFITEIKAYYNIVRALLEKPTGVYLCAYYAGLLKRYKNSRIAEAISNLVRVLNDRGGMHIYKWHTKKLLDKSLDDMQTYLEFIEDSRGCDPEYPRIDQIFRNEEQEREDRELESLIDRLGLRHHFKKQEKVSYKQLLAAYTQDHPDISALIAEYQRQFLSGLERQWTAEYIKQLDDMNIHSLLMRSVIRGIGTGYSIPGKSSSFAELYEKYGEVHSQMIIKANTNFVMPIKQILLSSSDQDAMARSQINLVMIEKVWNSLRNAEQPSIANVLAYINKWAIDLNEPLDKAFNEKVALEDLLKETEDEDTIKKTKKDIAKHDKVINALQEKRQNFTVIMEEFDQLNEDQKFILALILAGTAGKSDDEFSSFVTALLLQRYKEDEGINSRLEFLRDDISVDALSYQQFIYLLNLLDTVFFTLNGDEKIAKLLEDDTVMQNILAPYLITKKKQISLDALDAAAKKMTGYASMQAERSKWQDILEKTQQKNEKYFHEMEIYVSKTFLDSYYGDMGGICLSQQPQQILKPGFYVQRLLDSTEKQIIGMSILYLSSGGFSSPKIEAKNFWHAFAFNPLSSVLSHYSERQQLYLYLQYRANMENIAWATKLPVVISGIDTPWGLMSNNGCFGELIKKYEYTKPTACKVTNAKGLSVYYSEDAFAAALVIIDPRDYEEETDLTKVPTFYAHRELLDTGNFNF